MELQLIFEEFNDKLKGYFLARKVIYIIGSSENDNTQEVIDFVKSLYPLGSDFIIGDVPDPNKISIIIVKDKYPHYGKLVKDNVIVASMGSLTKTIEQVFNVVAVNNNRKNINNLGQIGQIINSIPNIEMKQFFIVDNYRFPIFNPGQPLGCKICYLPSIS